MSGDTKAHAHFTHEYMVWVDCEMTGLDIKHDKLLEGTRPNQNHHSNPILIHDLVACLLTDSNLKEIDALGPLVVNCDKEVLDRMNKWCIKTHTKTGLVKAALNSNYSVDDVDQQLHSFLSKHQIKYGLLAGNSVSYDRIFLEKYCPKFYSCLHYRNLDVSSFKEVIRFIV